MSTGEDMSAHNRSAFDPPNGLSLRPFGQEDAGRIVYLLGDFRISRNLSRVPFPYSLQDANAWLELQADQRARGEEFSFAVTLPLDGLIGSCGVRSIEGRPDAFELGYWLGRPYWNKGYTTAACRLLMDWAQRERDAKIFLSGHFIDNPASGAVLRKLGFVRTHTEELFGLARGEAAPAERYIWPEGARAGSFSEEPPRGSPKT